MRRGVVLARWPLPRAGHDDLAVVDRLARLQLAARRLGCTVCVDHPDEDLRRLLRFVGLEVLLGEADLPGEMGG